MESTRIILAVIAGAFVTTLFGLVKPMPTAIGWLERLFKDRTEVWYARADFVLVWLCGSAAGYLLYDPKDPQQGFMAGLGFVGLIRLAIGKFEPKEVPQRGGGKLKK
jgi:hypothetical protein